MALKKKLIALSLATAFAVPAVSALANDLPPRAPAGPVLNCEGVDLGRNFRRLYDGLEQAVRENDLQMASALMPCGGREFITAANDFLYQALFEGGSADMVALLLKNQGTTGKSELFSQFLQIAMYELVKDPGLSSTEQNDLKEKMRLLVKYGADLNANDNSVAAMAASSGNPALAAFVATLTAEKPALSRTPAPSP